MAPPKKTKAMALEYEQQRQENIKRNREMIASILHQKSQLASLLSPPKANKNPLKERSTKPNPPLTSLRRSLRTRGLPPPPPPPPVLVPTGRLLYQGIAKVTWGFVMRILTRKMEKGLQMGFMFFFLIEVQFQGFQFILFQSRSLCYRGDLCLMDMEKEMFDIIHSSDVPIFSLSQSPNDHSSLFLGEVGKAIGHEINIINLMSSFTHLNSINDTVRILSGPNFEHLSIIKHNNQTGQKLSSFRAICGWNDSYIFIGNVQRAVDVISTEDNITTPLQSEYMTNTPCRFATHPYKEGHLACAGGVSDHCPSEVTVAPS
ncbi:WD repeat-containing protein 76 [Carex littledalei]|uniref:WD repeat-containing protein 76 n=1 Tax=Carex littledalei TaxID=544730 RepID=A0A833R103_9POAL|nr:WD repeat-containing protein 76 [Carex littledalei]